MKIDSIIIDQEQDNSTYLRKCLLSNFPALQIHGEAANSAEATRLIKVVSPELIFLDVETVRNNSVPTLSGMNSSEVVHLSYHAEDAIHAIQQGACGFLLKPLDVSDIVASVGSTIHRLAEKVRNRVVTPAEYSPPSQKPIGIPTMDGIEFLNVREIIRCEGLQKCTRIVMVKRTSLISSYCIGEFRKLLGSYDFFSCHKSHLINLLYVRKLTREGFIIMVDNVAVPLARRKRIEFLQNVKHL